MIVRLIFAIAIAYLVYRLARGLFLPSGKRTVNFPGRPAAIKGEDLVKDPCCGTYVPVSNALKATLHGEDLYFCSEECLENYKKRDRKD